MFTTLFEALPCFPHYLYSPYYAIQLGKWNSFVPHDEFLPIGYAKQGIGSKKGRKMHT
jgi:hypothetical protein